MLTLRQPSMALVLTAVLTMPIAIGADGSLGVWVAGPPMADARESHSATVLKDGRVLVVSLPAEIYDPASNRWSPAGTPAITRTNKTATRLDDGRVLLAGGIDNTTGRSVPNAELYDPTTDTWTAAASMAGRRYDHTATQLRDGRVLVVGGTRSTVVLDSVEIYDPKANTWSAAANLPTPRSDHTATLLRDGRVLVAGGEGANATILYTAELYDPAANAWSPTGTMAVGRRGFSATLLKDGSVLVVGGLPSPPAQIGFSSAELFRPATLTWHSAGLSSQPPVTDGLATTILSDGRVLVCGGAMSIGLAGAKASGFIYDPALDRWSPTRDMTRGRVYPSASLLRNGRVLVAGGRDAFLNGTPLNTTEIFDPTPAANPAASSPRVAAPAETASSRVVIAPLVAGGLAFVVVIALGLVTPTLVGRWRRRRGI